MAVRVEAVNGVFKSLGLFAGRGWTCLELPECPSSRVSASHKGFLEESIRIYFQYPDPASQRQQTFKQPSKLSFYTVTCSQVTRDEQGTVHLFTPAAPPVSSKEQPVFTHPFPVSSPSKNLNNTSFVKSAKPSTDQPPAHNTTPKNTTLQLPTSETQFLSTTAFPPTPTPLTHPNPPPPRKHMAVQHVSPATPQKRQPQQEAQTGCM
ncbi:hypothetical protein B0T18DRAFT_27018 [Schizothecium vesticola]|uniref:Uncharacterized protein n=1 Tax=Schizothecium vesticola TaxID=314040 RepID=A0AA40KCC9_9PEZI|nr:hypothetical protein B0T18DRAFT_27018 [Schizothecium vesticola]